jgi:IMP dehydrogenase
LADKVDVSIAKLKSVMCNLGNFSLKDFHSNARLTRVSEMTIVEGGTSTVEQLDRIEYDRDR